MPIRADPFVAFSSRHDRLLPRLYERAGAARWGLSADTFIRSLHASVAQQTRDAALSSASEARYLESLHLEDLALACACREGIERAWEEFIARFRSDLYAAARAIAGEPAARDLADSLYADLYGLETRSGSRRSLFAYFHGRSKLSTWLRAVLAQRHVDAIRAGRRFEPLGDIDVLESAPGGRVDPPDPDRARLMALLDGAVRRALAGLEPRDRLRLAYYYAHDLTLAQTGRLTGEHEATVSRKLSRTRQQIRKDVERRLREEHRLEESEISLCFEYAVGDWPSDLTGVLTRPR